MGVVSTILDALKSLIVVQRELVIEAPVPLGVTSAFYLPPDRNTPLEYPCWFNTWTFTGQNRKSNYYLQQTYAVHCEFWHYDPDTDLAAEVATAFHSAYVVALNKNITLSGTVDTSELRGADPTLVLAEWNGVPYAGLDLFLDVTISQSVAYA
jgi:hypothetical protein